MRNGNKELEGNGRKKGRMERNNDRRKKGERMEKRKE